MHVFLPITIATTIALSIYIHHLQRQINHTTHQLEQYQALHHQYHHLTQRQPHNFPHLSPKTSYASVPNSNENTTALLLNWTTHLNHHTPNAWQQPPPPPPPPLDQDLLDQNLLDCYHDTVISHHDLTHTPPHLLVQRASLLLRECGVVYLDNLYSTQFVDHLFASYTRFLRNTSYAKLFRYPCQGQGRVEHMMPFEPPFNTTPSLLQAPYSHPLLLSIVERFLQNPYKLELMTVIDSRANSSNQRWHQGWRYLYHQTERLPPSGLVVTLPLKDVTIEMGPTQFCPRKKLRFYHGWRCPVHPIQAGTTKGTVVMFDYKTLHRGPGNRDPHRHRPMVSMVFSKSWFVNVEAYINRGISLLQTLHQRRYWEQWYWHGEAQSYFQV